MLVIASRIRHNADPATVGELSCRVPSMSCVVLSLYCVDRIRTNSHGHVLPEHSKFES